MNCKSLCLRQGRKGIRSAKYKKNAESVTINFIVGRVEVFKENSKSWRYIFKISGSLWDIMYS